MAISACFLKWYPIWITFLHVHVHRWGLINLNSNGRSHKSHDFKSPVFPRGVCYSCTDSFLGVIKTFFIPFKTFVKRCFISWRSSCLAAGLVFENRNDISVESAWAGYASSFSKVVSKFREVLGEAVGVTLIYWLPPKPRAHHFPLSRPHYQLRVPEEAEWEESTGWFGVWQSGEVGGWGRAPDGHSGWWRCGMAS